MGKMFYSPTEKWQKGRKTEIFGSGAKKTSPNRPEEGANRQQKLRRVDWYPFRPNLKIIFRSTEGTNTTSAR